MHFTPGTSRFSRREVPVKVPLVPMLVTKCVTRPSVWLDNFGAGAVEMRAPVGGVAVLVGIKVFLGACGEDLLAETNRSVGAFAGIGKHHFRAVGFQNLFAFMRGIGGQAQFRAVALDGADHRIGDAGVAAGGVEQNVIFGQAPERSPSRIMFNPARSLTDPPGLKNSALA